MKLRTRIPISLGAILVAMVIVMYLAIFTIVSNETRQIEQNIMDSNIDRVLQATDQEGASLQVSAGDYAAWDDTYQFVDDKNQAYIDSNFGSDSFANLHVNLVAVLNDQREVLYSRHYDWNSGKDLPVPQDLQNALQKHVNIFNFKDPHSKYTDYFTLDGQLMFLAARPIVTSDYQGPIKGTIIMMRVFDEDYLTKLASLTELNVNFVKKENISVPQPDRAVNFLGDNDMEAVFAVKNDEGEAQTFLRIVRDRSVNQLALQTLSELLIFFILFTVITILAILGLVDRFILRRIVKFSNAVTQYQTDPSLFTSISHQGKDELTLLAATVQKSFEELDLSRKKIRDHAEKIDIERRKLDAILHSIAEGVFMVDAKGHILLANRKVRKLSGRTHEELFNSPFHKHLKFVQGDTIMDMNFLKPVFQKGIAVQTQHDVLFMPKKGGPIHVTIEASPIKKYNKVIAVVVVFKDMSHEYEVDKMKTEFVSIASHQLHTPLTSIKWMLSLLFQGQKESSETKKTGMKRLHAVKLSPSQLEFLKNIDESNERMIQLVDDLLNISRIESAKAKRLEKTNFDMNELIDEAMNEQEGIAHQLGVKLESADGRTPCVVRADRDKFYQVIMNLANNAIKYSKKGGIVKLGCGIDGDVAQIFVKDFGIGIPKEQQSKIFEKFFRAENAIKSLSLGTGLGLYYVKMVVDAHGGRVWFESEPNKETTFYFTLPVKGEE